MFLVRAIKKSRWISDREDLDDSHISAWGITLDLKAERNELSFWSCEDDSVESRREAVLAIAAQGRNQPDRIEFVWLSEKLIKSDGLEIAETNGSTYVKSLEKTHRDLKSINETRLISIARRVDEAIKDGKYGLFTPGQVTKLLAGAVNDGRLDLNKLKGKVKDKVQKAIQKETINTNSQH